jgi:hypothetical protein
MSQPAVAAEAQETAWVALQRLTTSGLRHLWSCRAIGASVCSATDMSPPAHAGS